MGCHYLISEVCFFLDGCITDMLCNAKFCRVVLMPLWEICLKMIGDGTCTTLSREVTGWVCHLIELGTFCCSEILL
jgi:hypothetical protein